MRLSAGFNVFDGGELLVPALKCLRREVDHLCLVVQEVSNFGHPISPLSRDAVRQAQALGLVDDVVCYTPDLALTGTENEFRKRAIGRARAEAAGADHVMFCDVDEFYDPAQLAQAKGFITAQALDCTSLTYANYFGRPTLKLVSLDGAQAVFHTSFICRLTDQTLHRLGGWYPLPGVDPTRRIHVPGGRHHLFAAEEIVMHHMTGVRWDIEAKLANASSNDDPAVIGQRRRTFALLPDLSAGMHRLPDGRIAQFEEVPDQFGLGGLFAGATGWAKA